LKQSIAIGAQLRRATGSKSPGKDGKEQRKHIKNSFDDDAVEEEEHDRTSIVILAQSRDEDSSSHYLEVPIVPQIYYCSPTFILYPLEEDNTLQL
jgi:hypothetical protein